MAAAVKDSSFPIILGRDLPLYTGTLSEGDTVLAIIGNTNLKRVPVTSFAPDAVKTEVGAPDTPASPGTAGGISWDETGVYTYLDGTWGLSPRLTTNWDDFSGNARFLVVDKEQNLSEQEQWQGRQNLGVVEATIDTPGLVVIQESLEEGDTGGAVPTVFAVMQYLSTFRPNIDEILQQATTDQLGIVKLATSVSATDQGVPTAALVYTYVQTQLSEVGVGKAVPPATTSSYGTVKLATEIAASGGNVPTAELVYTYVNSQLGGTGGVQHASTSQYGIVQLASSINSGDNNVPTSGQVYDFTRTQVANNVPQASTSQFGTVKLTTSMNASGNVVPTASVIKAWVESKISGLSAGGGGSSSGGDKISSYKGEISIKGPNNEEILVYNSSTKTLTVGKGIVVKQVTTTPIVDITNSTHIS